MLEFIPYGRHAIDEDDIQSVVDVLRGDWLTCGPVVEQFEQALADFTGSEYAISCSNGTTALHLALLALGIKEGDWVIVPAITFLATANAVRYVNADVIFADVDPNTGLVTPEILEAVIESFPEKNKIKAFINVHLAGQCENLELIAKIAKKYDLFIIEDAAHAIGTNYIDAKGVSHPIGSCHYADITTFSFHPVKTIATGEGGAVTTNSSYFAEKLKLFRSHGMTRKSDEWVEKQQGFDEITGKPNPWYYEMQDLGFNYRISDINCALGISQLKKIKKFKKARSEIVDQYDEAFKNHSFVKPIIKNKNSDTAWHLYVLLIDFKLLNKSRASVIDFFKKNNIGTQVHYIPVYSQPYYKKLYGEVICSGSEQYYKNCLSLPLHINLTHDHLSKVIKLIKNL
jgi:UDP-4-amino-4,6-dideoxy-N-acetyl-beta-L-altrosamine transaminase